jgi:tetratricopeptide (TPR) repeat protein
MMHDSRDTSSSRHGDQQPVIAKLLSELKQCPLYAAQRLHELSVAAERAGRLHDALSFADAQVDVAKEANSPQTTILALLTRGKLLFKLNRFSDAIPELREALNLSASDPSLPAVHRVHVLYTTNHLIAASLWRQGDRVAAASAQNETTRLARMRFGAGSVEVLKSLCDQAFLAIEMHKPEAHILSLIDECAYEPTPAPERADRLLEIGQALYLHCLWDAATHTLRFATKLSADPVQKTEALLILANIACHRSDMRSLHHYVDKAESFWMDVAPRPHLERHIAHLRAMAALHEGCEETYREQMYKAQQRSELEEPRVEDLIQIQFVRAQVLRRSGLHEEARREIEEAQRLVDRAIVSPLTRCAILLQQAFCEHMEGNYHESNTLIDAALTITHEELDRNPVLDARGRTLKAHNLCSIFTYSEMSPHDVKAPLLAAKKNAESALRSLTDLNLDPLNRMALLRLLSEITNHLGLDAEQASYDNQLAMLREMYPDRDL